MTTIINRRVALALAMTAFAPPAFSQEAPNKAKAMLDAASPLGDRILGNADAPVTLIEYASATCPHCAEFHMTLLPQIKTEYIDTGKVKFIFREFPLDQMALGVFMLTRCLPEEKFFATTDLLFRRQQTWTKAENPGVEITKIMNLAGMDKPTFEACLKKVDMAKAMNEFAKKSAADFNIKGTPALFVNGEYVDGHKDMTDVKKALDAAIAAASQK
jgi:protein-disulfide isomerase